MTEFFFTADPDLRLRFAVEEDTELILTFIRELAAYEKLSHEVIADEETLRDSLFRSRKVAEVVIAEYAGKPAGFALFFHNFSTFLGRPGIYLEDLYVRQELRGKRIGKQILCFLAKIAQDRGCGRLEWWALDWNEPAINFYRQLGAYAMDEWTVYRVTGETLKDLAESFGEA